MSERQRISSLLRRYDIRLSKRLGQNFLVDAEVLARIVQATQVGHDCDVVEVGAGVGNLSAALARTGAHVTALELDKRFAPIHVRAEADLRGPGTLRFVYEDALDFDYATAAAAARAAGRYFVIVGNIPYQITSPLVMKVLEEGLPLASMTLMMQREVSERLAAKPGSRRNGAITIKAQYFADVKPLFDVGRTAFLPPPEVTSQVVRFVPHAPALDEAKRPAFFALVAAAFMQRRKMMANAVSARGIASREKVAAALETIGKPTSARAEELSLSDFLALYAELSDKGPAH